MAKLTIVSVLLFTLLGNTINVDCNDLSNNPCDGSELFGLVCKMLQVLKSDVETGNKEIETRFNALSDLQKSSTKEMKMELAKESNLLSKKHAADVKMLIGLIEEKIQSTTSVLQSKIEANRKKTYSEISALSNTTKINVNILKEEVEKRIKNNTSMYTKSVEKLETRITDGKQELNQIIQSEKATIVKDFDNKIKAITISYLHHIDSVKKLLEQQIQQGKQQWPAGNFCILRSGACPPGFKSIDGYMRAIVQYAVNTNYVKAANFGSSSIRCHGYCGQYGKYSELNLSTCCK